MNLKKSILFYILFFVITSNLFAQGLKFSGQEVPINKRTSYNVFDAVTPEFDGRMDISFDIALYGGSEIGCILRLKDASRQKVYNLFYDGRSNSHRFMLNDEGFSCLLKAALDKKGHVNTLWMKVRLSFDMERDSVRLDIAGKSYYSAVPDLPDRWSPEIYFGKSDYYIDVPSFAIKNLEVSGAGRKKPYSFSLDEKEGETVHDLRGKPVGRVVNPEWLMNDFSRWKKLCAMSSATVASSGYNPAKKEVYYFNSDTLFTYNVLSGTISSVPFDGSCPLKMKLGNSFIDPDNDVIYAYEVWYRNPKDTLTPTVAKLDLNTLTWEAVSYDRLPMQMHHHGCFFDYARSRYTVFGGFGNMHYNGDFYTYDLQTQQWRHLNNLTGDRICPRYFTSMGYDRTISTMYIFGGMGNESGEQAVGRRYLYDLYSVDLTSGTVRKLWETGPMTENIVPVRSLYANGTGYFYTLCYPESRSESELSLYRFSIKDGSFSTLADRIPIMSDKIGTNANLYYDPELEKFYALLYETKDDISSTLSVYSLSFTPDVSTESSDSGSWKRIVWPLSAVMAAVLLFPALAVVLIRRRRHRSADTVAARPEYNSSVTEYGFRQGGTTHDTVKTVNSICFFGPFRATDKNGKDITQNFTPMQRKMLCLIVYYSVSGGISTRRLGAILWPDKQGESLKNLRNATLNYLRKALSDIGGVKIVYKSGNYFIESEDGFYCDYIRLYEITKDETVSPDDADELAGILSQGAFMDSIEDISLDAVKENVGQMVMRSLLPVVKDLYDKKGYADVLTFCEAMFRIDPFSDFALKYQISSLCRIKRTDEALLRYSTFIVEYRKVYDEDYPYRFEDLQKV